MTKELSDKLIGYHYTNEQAYLSMHDGSSYGKNGLIPIKRFVRYSCGKNLPKRAHDGVIEALLGPEPKSWIENPEFPNLWGYLMHDICKKEKVILLSFEILPTDKAFVVDRAHVERFLYHESKTNSKPTKSVEIEAFRNYWKSRIPAFNYEGGYDVSQLAIWSKIGTDRLKVEWMRSSREVWERAKENNW